MTTPRKEKKREARREEKAEKAAVLDKVVILCSICYLSIWSIYLSIHTILTNTFTEH